MLSYLFLFATTIIAPELPTIELTLTESQAIQEIVAVLTQEENTSITATETSTTTETLVAVKIQPITITNAIEPSMLEYKHWTGKYSPDEFSISVNGVKIESGKTCDIPANSKTVEIGYTYSFMNGMKSGGRKISYELNENIAQAHISFNWKDDWRVIVDQGRAIKEVNT